MAHSKEKPIVGTLFYALFVASAIGFLIFAILDLVGDSNQKVEFFGSIDLLGNRRIEIISLEIFGALYSGGIAYGISRRSEWARRAIFAPYALWVPAGLIIQGPNLVLFPALIISIVVWYLLYRIDPVNEYFSDAPATSPSASR